MSQSFLKFHHVTFGYESASECLFEELSFHLVNGWSGVVGANGTGKTTLLKLAAGLLVPDTGRIDHPSHAIYCPQRTDDVPTNLDELMSASSREAELIRSQLALAEDWAARWPTLSHGERKRAQLGVALWQQPDLLAIDEPTNHLDSYARELIFAALRDYRGIGLLVSHDRELLDSLCQQCIFMHPPAVIIQPGGISHGMEVIRQQQQSVQRQYRQKKQAFKSLLREARRRKASALQADRRRSKRGLAPKDHDSREKINRARVSGQDGHAGQLVRQLSGRLEQMQAAYQQIQVQKEYTLGIWLPGSFSRRDYLLRLPAGSLALGEQRRLEFPDLVIKPGDRIAITGANGVGKSTLVRQILTGLAVDADRVTYVPQEIDLPDSQKILALALDLPHDKLGHLMTIVSRLGSRPERLLASAEPSPGETRKLLLALGMTAEPHIIIMDEPTNHMDLPSIQCLENALADCPCGLVLVSHDRYFLNQLTRIEWSIVENDGTCQLTVK